MDTKLKPHEAFLEYLYKRDDYNDYDRMRCIHGYDMAMMDFVPVTDKERDDMLTDLAFIHGILSIKSGTFSFDN